MPSLWEGYEAVAGALGSGGAGGGGVVDLSATALIWPKIASGPRCASRSVSAAATSARASACQAFLSMIGV